MIDSERVKGRRDMSIYGKRECVGDTGWRTVIEKRARERVKLCVGSAQGEV